MQGWLITALVQEIVRNLVGSQESALRPVVVCMEFSSATGCWDVKLGRGVILDIGPHLQISKCAIYFFFLTSFYPHRHLH